MRGKGLVPAKLKHQGEHVCRVAVVVDDQDSQRRRRDRVGRLGPGCLRLGLHHDRQSDDELASVTAERGAGMAQVVRRVGGVVAVVTHHEDRAGRHRDGPEVDRVDAGEIDVRLAAGATVDRQHAVAQLDAIAGEPDDPLELHVTAALEGDEVAAPRLAAAIGGLVDEDLVAG